MKKLFAMLSCVMLLVACGSPKSDSPPPPLPVEMKKVDLGLFIGGIEPGIVHEGTTYIGQLYTTMTSGGIYIERKPGTTGRGPSTVYLQKCYLDIEYQGANIYSHMGTLTCGDDVMQVYVTTIWA